MFCNVSFHFEAGSPCGTCVWCVCAKSLQSCLTLCDPMDCSLPGSSVLGLPQARILEWVAMPSSWGSSQPGEQTCVYVSCIGGQFLHHWRHLLVVLRRLPAAPGALVQTSLVVASRRLAVLSARVLRLISIVQMR